MAGCPQGRPAEHFRERTNEELKWASLERCHRTIIIEADNAGEQVERQISNEEHNRELKPIRNWESQDHGRIESGREPIKMEWTYKKSFRDLERDQAREEENTSVQDQREMARATGNRGIPGAAFLVTCLTGWPRKRTGPEPSEMFDGGEKCRKHEYMSEIWQCNIIGPQTKSCVLGWPVAFEIVYLRPVGNNEKL